MACVTFELILCDKLCDSSADTISPLGHSMNSLAVRMHAGGNFKRRINDTNVYENLSARADTRKIIDRREED